MNTRTGKIARLPRNIRDELNHRLDNGEAGTVLVAWLNAQPEVQKSLAANFAGRPITEPNLSEWKQGGFQDWRHLQEMQDLVQSIAEESSALAKSSADTPVSALLSGPMAVALARCLRKLDYNPSDPASHRALLAIAREISWLRRSDNDQQLLHLKCERWLAEQTKAKAEQAAKAESEEASAPMTKLMQILLLEMMQRMHQTNMTALNPQNPPNTKLSPETIASLKAEFESI